MPSGTFLGSPVHTASIDLISPDRIIGAKTCAINSGTCPTTSSHPIVLTTIALHSVLVLEFQLLF